MRVSPSDALALIMSGAIIWAAVSDVRSRLIPRAAGFGVLALGLLYLLLGGFYLEGAFYLAAIWGSRGGLWRIAVLALGVMVWAQSPAMISFVLGILYVLTIFGLGWFGGGDAQLAFGLLAMARDGWILAYLFGGTIVLGLSMMLLRRGPKGGIQRLWWVLRHLHSPDAEAIRFPWAVLASLAGLAYIWVFPGAV